MSYVHQQWEPVVLRKPKPTPSPPPINLQLKKELEEYDEKPKAVNLGSFGKRVQSVRLKHGLKTQSELAKMINEPVSTIASIESGKLAPQPVITKINSALKLFKTEDFLQVPKH